ITYSFIDPKLHKLFSRDEGIELLNPISADMSIMRTSLIPGLVNTLKYNLNRQKNRVQIFESGLRFAKKTGGFDQVPSLAGLIFGPKNDLNWNSEKQDVDFYDIKGDIESLLAISGSAHVFAPGEREYLHPGQCADINVDGQVV